MATLYRRKDSPYWWCWGRYPDGEKWQASTRQKGKRLAERAARIIERQKLDEAESGYPPVALADAMDILREHKRRKGCSDATMKILEQKRARLEDHFGEDTDVLSLTLADTEGYLDARRGDTLERIGGAQPVSDHTIAKELGALKQALRVLRRHDLYPHDPADLWPDALSSVYTPRDRWLTVDEYQALCAALKPEQSRYVVAYCQTGMRASELYQCRREGDSLVVTQTKGNKGTGETTERVIPLSVDAKRLLDEDPLPWPVWNASNQNRTLRLACKRAGIGRVSPNDFRRTFCSWLVQAGVPELTIIRLMGHSSSQMVRRVYAQLAPETLEAAVSKLPSVPRT